MLDLRTVSLIRVSVLTSRPEFQNELIEELRTIKSHNSTTRPELYEVCLQSYLFAGFPSALESLRCLLKVFGADFTLIKSEDEIIAAYKKYYVDGDKLYKKVYGANAERVREEMIRLSPDLAAWAMIEGYGKALSRTELDMKTREFCIVAMLTQLGWERQLYSHILGAKNIGASKKEIYEASVIGAKGSSSKLEIAEQLIKKLV